VPLQIRSEEVPFVESKDRVAKAGCLAGRNKSEPNIVVLIPMPAFAHVVIIEGVPEVELIELLVQKRLGFGQPSRDDADDRLPAFLADGGDALRFVRVAVTSQVGMFSRSGTLAIVELFIIAGIDIET
jgi:hypothetical protein